MFFLSSCCDSLFVSHLWLVKYLRVLEVLSFDDLQTTNETHACFTFRWDSIIWPQGFVLCLHSACLCLFTKNYIIHTFSSNASLAVFVNNFGHWSKFGTLELIKSSMWANILIYILYWTVFSSRIGRFGIKEGKVYLGMFQSQSEHLHMENNILAIAPCLLVVLVYLFSSLNKSSNKHPMKHVNS